MFFSVYRVRGRNFINWGLLDKNTLITVCSKPLQKVCLSDFSCSDTYRGKKGKVEDVSFVSLFISFFAVLKPMEGRWDKEMYILKVLITFNLLSLCVQGGYDVYVLGLWIFIRMCVRLPLDMCTCAHVRVQHQLSILLYCLLPFF